MIEVVEVAENLKCSDFASYTYCPNSLVVVEVAENLKCSDTNYIVQLTSGLRVVEVAENLKCSDVNKHGLIAALDEIVRLVGIEGLD